MNQTDYDWDALKVSTRRYLLSVFPKLEDSVEDIVQDIFLVLLKQEKPIDNPEAFCIGCANQKYHEILNKKRKEQLNTDITTLHNVYDHRSPSPEDYTIMRDKLSFAYRFLSKQKPKIKDIVQRMIFVEPFHTENLQSGVADSYGISTGAVDMVVSRFRRKLNHAYTHGFTSNTTCITPSGRTPSGRAPSGRAPCCDCGNLIAGSYIRCWPCRRKHNPSVYTYVKKVKNAE